MAYNEELSLRVNKRLIELNCSFIEKKMFGGNAFMINDKMCVGIMKAEVMLRVLDSEYEVLIESNHVHPMNFTGKTMKGFLLIEAEGLKKETDLNKWIDYGLEFSKFGIVKSKKKK
ncbi:TfoX/Sxy family protein [Flavobacterium cellulosilyticum]|uniref:TfoX family protein n=1 Tax=Flavobacterium cellulosilyticum TaxID=2541731 RepID=A0A4R5C6R8_9FLAO|nr:TfoX/Sxy family protein [Flavobacterium cellulosilyticum]TDD93813.1 TfoX family protein [Flavobacterium cellulosilyticum]